jgi:hypothetical protein
MRKFNIHNNYQLLVVNFDELTRYEYMFEAMKLLKKRYKYMTYSDIIEVPNERQRYILIIKNNKLQGFIYSSYNVDLHIIRFYLKNIKSDIMKHIIYKLKSIYVKIMVSLRTSDKKLIKVLTELKFGQRTSIKKYNGTGLDDGYEKIFMFNWFNTTSGPSSDSVSTSNCK